MRNECICAHAIHVVVIGVDLGKATTYIIYYCIAFGMIRKLLAPFFLRKSYNLAEPYFAMAEKRRTMPICFTSDQLKLIEEYAKRRGILNLSQAIEDLMTR